MTPLITWDDSTLDVSTLPQTGRVYKISPGPDARAAIAARLGVPAVEACSATLNLQPMPGGDFKLKGWLQAKLERRCVVTDEPVTEEIDERFVCWILLEEPVDDPENLDDDRDIEVVENGMVNLAELATQQLAVAMTPYPRAPEADAVMAELAPSVTEDEASGDNPFAALAGRLRNGAAAGDSRDTSDGSSGSGEK